MKSFLHTRTTSSSLVDDHPPRIARRIAPRLDPPTDDVLTALPLLACGSRSSAERSSLLWV